MLAFLTAAVLGTGCQDAGGPCSVNRDAVAILQWGTTSDDLGNAVSVDGRCDVVVAGATAGALVAGADTDGAQSDLFVARWDARGEQILLRQLGTEFDDDAEAVAVDGEGAVILAGGTAESAELGAAQDVLLVKLELGGTEAWRLRRGAPELGDIARSVVVDAEGVVYAAGMSNEQPDRGTEMFLLEVGPGGTGERMTWVGAAEGSSPHELGQGVALDADGEVVLVGSSLGTYAGAPSGSFDAVMTRLRADRTEAWAQRRGTADIDAALDVVVDADGSTYVAVVSYSDLLLREPENDGKPSGYVYKFDRAGNQQWLLRVGDPGVFTRINALALDPDGKGVFVAGVTDGTLGAEHLGARDAFVAHVTASGYADWRDQFGTAVDDEANAVAVDPRGYAVVTGTTAGDLAGTGNAGLKDAFVAWRELP